MKAITIRQPWASLIAEGIKTIETRPRRTTYRGRVAIHAGASLAGIDALPGDADGKDEDGWVYGYVGDYQAAYCAATGDTGRRGEAELWHESFGIGPRPLPLGVVVASAVLTDCLPILDHWPENDGRHVRIGRPIDGNKLTLYLGHPHHEPFHPADVADQLPFGDFTPGRWALLLDDIRPTTERCPACWRTPHCSTCDDSGSVPVPGGGKACDACFRPSWPDCRVCDDYGWADPVPARGQQAVPWNWSPS